MTLSTPSTPFERELRSILVRHLPVGLEGIGTAQAAAVVNLLRRTERARERAPADPHTRTGLRLLKDAATAHAASVCITRTGSAVCGMCRTPTGDPQPWPCQVRLAAQYLRVTDEAPGTTTVVG